jgi:FkbM family methyltransferase
MIERKSINLMSAVKDILRPLYHQSCRIGHQAIRSAFNALRAVLGPRRFLKLIGVIRGNLNTTIEVAGFQLEAGNPIPFYRAETLLTKEPDTICWIDEFVSEGDVFYDVGANVGVFSLYAARKGAQVIAFEPFAENYAILNRNIHLNGMDEQITALNLAVHNETVVSHLNLSGLQPGKAGHSFQQPIGSDGKPYAPTGTQAVIGVDLDSFIVMFSPQKPNFVKIDIDGNDHLVARGMERLFRDRCLRGIAIELNIDERREDQEIIGWIESFGFERLNDRRFVNQAYIDMGIQSRNHFFKRIG